jgi:hypothetical protein
MSYRQYTKCVDASNFVGFAYVQYVLAGGTAVAAGALALLLSGAFVPGLMIGALSGVIAYCLWWLYDRLICNGGDVCAVGFVLSYERPQDKSGLDAFDTDFSLNLVLPPTLVGVTQAHLAASAPLGNLVTEQSGVQNYSFLNYQLPFTGNLVTKFPTGNPDGSQFSTATLHAEFEGAGVYDLLQACKAALALAVVAAAVCGIPIIGWIACTILSIVAGVVTLVGAVNALNDVGNPGDVNPMFNSSPIHAANTPDGDGADILVVRGTWVYDSAHSGWNEIHPIKQCCRIGTMINQQWSEIQIAKNEYISITDVQAWVAGWCGALLAVVSPPTLIAQAQPENQWSIHPLIDGCQPPGPPPQQPI